MRLTAGCEATVVRELRGKARRFARAQNEARDGGLERCPILAEKPVMALHPALARLEDAEALIFVDGAGHYRRLLADDAFAKHFGVDAVADGVMNQPAPRQKLGSQSADVFDADEVGEDVVTLRGLGVIPQIHWSHGDANAFGFAVEEASCGHAST